MQYVIPAVKSQNISLRRLTKVDKLFEKFRQLTREKLAASLNLVYSKKHFQQHNQQPQMAFSNSGNSLQLTLQQFQNICLHCFAIVEQKR